MALYVSIGDGVVDNSTEDLFSGRPSRAWCCRSLLGTAW